MATRRATDDWPRPFDPDAWSPRDPPPVRRWRQAARFAVVVACLAAVPLPYVAIGRLWGADATWAAIAYTPAAGLLAALVWFVWDRCGEEA